jgi:hypothetical protein
MAPLAGLEWVRIKGGCPCSHSQCLKGVSIGQWRVVVCAGLRASPCKPQPCQAQAQEQEGGRFWNAAGNTES